MADKRLKEVAVVAGPGEVRYLLDDAGDGALAVWVGDGLARAPEHAKRGAIAEGYSTWFMTFNPPLLPPEALGFSREDVAYLKTCATMDDHGNEYIGPPDERLMSLAARIAALLPPE